jgi:colanic acid/amylovoran biosynthesis protein
VHEPSGRSGSADLDRPGKVVISNAIALNGGDAAILQATIHILSGALPDGLSVTVYDMSAEASARYYRDLLIKPAIYDQITRWGGSAGPWRKRLLKGFMLLAAASWRTPLWPLVEPLVPEPLRSSLSDYAEADVIVSSGGTYLVPHYNTMSKLYDFAVALLLGRPLVLFTQSLGPFPRGKRRALTGLILRHARLILVRDKKSLTSLLDLGVSRERVHVCADSAFALAPHHLAPRSIPSDRRLRIAISVRDWPHFKTRSATAGMTSYLDSIAGLTLHLLSTHNADVTFLSTCQGAPEYWTDDSRTAEMIVARLPLALRGRIAVDRNFHTPAQLMDEFSRFDLVVATRLHGAILALCAGTPVIPISYEFKTSELFARLGFKRALIDMETISPKRLIDAVNIGIHIWRTEGDEIWAMVGRQRASALDAGVLVGQSLGWAIPDGRSAETGHRAAS